MKSSSRTFLIFISILTIVSLSISLLIQTRATSSEGFDVSFEAFHHLDHVCFEINIMNNYDVNIDVPLKSLLNRTSIDISKVETRLWENEEYQYEVSYCKSCEVEFCRESNETSKGGCYAVSVEDCDRCGTETETKVGTRWAEKQQSDTDKTVVSQSIADDREYEKNKIIDEFEGVQLAPHEKKTYKLCYYFNEIPINPESGKPGSYGFMYLEIDEKLHFDFEHSSKWNSSIDHKRKITNIDSYANPFLVGDGIITINGTDVEVWCNYTATYLYYNNESGNDIYCINSTEDTDNHGAIVPTEIVGSDFNPDTENPWLDVGAIIVIHGNSDVGYDSGPYNYSPTVTSDPDIMGGKVGNALSFNGTEDKIQYGDIETLSSYATVMFWAKPAASDYTYPIGKHGGSQPRWWFEANTKWEASWQDNSGPMKQIRPKTSSSPSLYLWQHIASYVRSDTDSGCIYFNGIEEDCDTNSGFGIFGNAHSFTIGDIGSYSPSNVTLDEIWVFNVSKSAAQINASYWNMAGKGYSKLGEEDPPDDGVNESVGREAIETGIKNELGNNTVIYTDQQIYLRHANDNQELGTFDKVVIEGNQTWAFNYIAPADNINPKTNMSNMTSAIFIWEEAILSAEDIITQVQGLIESTNI